KDGQFHPVTQWGATPVATDHGPGSVAPLLGLLEDGALAIVGGDEVLASHGTIAALSPAQVRQLGLPPVAPYVLNIQSKGVLSSPSFRFRHQLQNASGVPVMGARRNGVLLRAGSATYTLLDPLFSLIEGMEAYNATPEADIDERFAAWQRLQALLPENALVDRNLKSMNITRADAVTLDLRDDDQFDPVFLAQPRLPSEDDERGEQASPSELLPPAAHQSFTDRFQRFSGAQRRYALSGNWFVMVPETLKNVLGIMREVQQQPAEHRRAFLANPYAHIKDKLGERVPDEEIESLFQETPAFLSARIERLGEWSPKLHAFVAAGTTEWLPPDQQISGSEDNAQGGTTTGKTVAIPTNQGVFKIPQGAITEVVDQLHEARAKGEASINWQGQQIPTDEATTSAFERVRDAQPAEPASEQQNSPTLAPIIKDNIGSLDFVADKRRRASNVGGLPALLQSTLFPHQAAGVQWLQEHWASGSPGSLLADDMGLGKTVQALAFLSWVNEQTAGLEPRKPHLIVAPTGLLRNWEAEADQHLSEPGLGELFRAYGQDLKALAALSGVDRRRRMRDQIRWVLTTYETLRDKIHLFIDVPWRVVVFDEAQKIKNPGARVTDMAKSLDADLTLALTGTPVENSLSDLWCIVDAVHPGLLGAHDEFKASYASPAAANDPTALAPLKEKLEHEPRPPLLLRRLKHDHIDGLPDKHIHLQRRTMPAAQADAYDEIVSKARTKQGEKGGMLEALHHLRRVSLLPRELGDDGLRDEDIAASARLSALIDVLDQIRASGEKALVFVEFLHVQEALIPYLRQRYNLPRDPLRIHGGTPGAQRAAHVNKFQSGNAGEFDLMVLSPKAAGVGLTLTAANHVIHLSRWWNPAVEDQCTDRVYRIGQKRDVHVHIPLAIHPGHDEMSFDANLHRLLEDKRGLSVSILAAPSTTSGELSRLATESLQSQPA
ncbi:MAG: DEAD/DEAH box helicase, partial [Chromatiaceae bacterium]|nr:DEAD/DEAH box helicase [Chromatiaceae bacterium]